MIAFFRKFLATRLVLALFALIMLAFLITGFGSGSGGLSNLSLGGSDVAKIGSMSISSNELASRIQSEFEAARQERPGLQMAEYEKLGGVDQTIERMINSRTILAFAEKHGMVISERLIDSEIAKTPAFYGPTGKFDRNTYLGVIGQRRLSEKDHRLDVKAGLIADQIIPAAAGAARAPRELLIPYASLLLERRFGQIGVVPSARYLGAAPTDAEVKTFYDRNISRYTVPETRVIRYATFDKSRFEATVSPSDADVQAAYKANAAKYAATEKRILSQVIVPTEAAAKAIADKARGGMPLAKAASESGNEASTLEAQDRKAFASLASAAAADAAFSAAQGSITGPSKSPLGWHVVRVDKIIAIGGKSLEQARAELLPDLKKRKVEEALADMIERIETAIDDGSTFDDVAKKEGLTVMTTPALTAGGIAPSDPGYKAPAELTAVLKEAYQSETDDEPSVVTITPNVRDALVKLDRINASAPKALADIRAQVAADVAADKAARAARKVAMDVVAKVNAGSTLSQSLTAAGLPPAQPLAAQRLQLAQAGDKAPAPLVRLFELAKGKAHMTEDPSGKGYSIVWLERLESGNAQQRPDLVSATQAELSRVLGNEYTQQLLTAMKADLQVQRNEAAIQKVKRSLLGGTAGQ